MAEPQLNLGSVATEPSFALFHHEGMCHSLIGSIFFFLVAHKMMVPLRIRASSRDETWISDTHAFTTKMKQCSFATDDTDLLKRGGGGGERCAVQRLACLLLPTELHHR